MPTMSTYELKVSGMLDNAGDPAKLSTAVDEFMLITNYNNAGWPKEFGQEVGAGPDQSLKKRAAIDEPSWELRLGSRLAPKSLIKRGSTLNGGLPIEFDIELLAETVVVGRTVLVRGSVLEVGSIVKPEPYHQVFWDPRADVVAKWEPEGETAKMADGSYTRLSLHGIIVTMRQGSLNEHWAKETAPRDLEWFYTYSAQHWFKLLMRKLLEFNAKWTSLAQDSILTEAVRVRDVKWYCGNGVGP